ncbi:MAG: VOC family protein [Erythrobacter sp.]|nr:VOC family protein [Erythrobacter sp.]
MGVKALGYVIIESAKLAEWDRFMCDVIGVMRGEGAPAGSAFYRIDDRPFRFWIREGGQEHFTAAGYELANAAELLELKANVAAAGRPVEDGTAEEAAQRGVASFFRTSDPDGNGLEFFCGDTRDDVPFVSPAGVSGFVTGDMGMGHAVFCAPSFEKTHDFYKNVVGFGDTDFPRFHFTDDPQDPGMGFAFMHADNGRHHSIAIAEMPVPPSGCVHLMLEMRDMADVGRCNDRMKAAKIPESATLGRHVNDRTFGFYMQTPGGFDMEIGFDPLVIDWKNWTTTAHTVPSEWGHEWAWQKALAEAQ